MYNEALLAVDPGASNLSGLANALPRMLIEVEAELSEEDKAVWDAVTWLNEAVDSAWDDPKCYGTRFVNIHPEVRKYVKQLVDYSYSTNHMRRVAAHPVMRLVVEQMRILAEVELPDYMPVSGLTLWSEAYNICVIRSGGKI